MRLQQKKYLKIYIFLSSGALSDHVLPQTCYRDMIILNIEEERPQNSVNVTHNYLSSFNYDRHNIRLEVTEFLLPLKKIVLVFST